MNKIMCLLEWNYKVNDFKVSWEDVSEEVCAPLFESFWQDRVVGVRKGVIDNFPGGFVFETFDIDENSH